MVLIQHQSIVVHAVGSSRWKTTLPVVLHFLQQQLAELIRQGWEAENARGFDLETLQGLQIHTLGSWNSLWVTSRSIACFGDVSGNSYLSVELQKPWLEQCLQSGPKNPAVHIQTYPFWSSDFWRHCHRQSWHCASCQWPPEVRAAPSVDNWVARTNPVLIDRQHCGQYMGISVSNDLSNNVLISIF